MANTFNNPLIFDTDFTSYRTAASKTTGIRVLKMALSAATATSAGVVQLSNSENSQVLYPPIGVVAAQATGTIILNDNPTGQGVLSWPDFGATGLTATGTKLYIWFGL